MSSRCSYCLGLGCQMCPTPIHPGGIGDPTEEELEIHILRTERDLLREQLDAAHSEVNHLRELVTGLVLLIESKGGA